MGLSEINTSLSTQIPNRFRAYAAMIGQCFNFYVDIISRRNQTEALYSRSDAELANMGLKREDIPRHVFSDMLKS